MIIKRLENALVEARRFIERCKELKLTITEADRSSGSIDRSKGTGAVKRSSMDLTRSLAELRKSDYD